MRSRQDPIYRDNDMLACYVRLLMVAVERKAHRTGGTLLLHRRDLLEITGTERLDAAKRRLASLSNSLPLVLHYLETNCRLTIPNLAKNQDLSENSRTIPVPKRGKRPASADANATVEKLMNLLSKEPGTTDHKRAWVEREYPLLVAYAEREYPGDARRQSAEVKTRVIRHYRQHHKAGAQPNLAGLSPAQARVARGKAAARRVYEEIRGDGE